MTMSEPTNTLHPQAQQAADSWRDDWGQFFGDLAALTGLTLMEAMMFHVAMCQHRRADNSNGHEEKYAQFLAEDKERRDKLSVEMGRMMKYLDREMPDEEWKG